MMIATNRALAAEFEHLIAERERSEPSWWIAARRDAFARFAELGYPTIRHEDWKYTNPAPLAQANFALATPARVPVTIAEALKAAGLSSWPGPILVLANGAYCGSHGTGSLAEGVRIESLAACLQRDPDSLGEILTRPAAPDNGFTHLNAALAADGAVVHLDRGAVLTDPILLVFFTPPGEQPAASHVRNIVVAQAGSQAEIVEMYVGARSVPYMTNTVTQLQLDASAVVRHSRVQREANGAYHTCSLQAWVGRDANFASHAVSLGAALARHDIQVKLSQEGASALLNGLYLGARKQHVDFHTEIDHVVGQTTSLQRYKGILDDAAVGVFNGKVVVRPEAQKSSAQQSNRNLLLSPHAQINAKPQLEIFADDVRCSHGATIGQLDASALFYLQSRGLSKAEARQLLTYAFASEILAGVGPAVLREALSGILFEQVPAGVERPS
ncbi:MAG: Fe-S cluster assembly protein SufD [Cyanobacteria bacterium REEB65]|nr:Fe-S cluster assembly protein SufD [Cyanobacteria bacterium REEB65]